MGYTRKSLAVNDPPVPTHFAIVLGCAYEHLMAVRIRHAINLFHAGDARCLVLSGGAIGQQRSEAEKMAEIAFAAGLTPDNLLLEERSSDTRSNAIECWKLLHAHESLKGKSTVLLVSSSWHMLRAKLCFQSVFAKDVTFLCCPPPAAAQQSGSDEIPEAIWIRNELRLLNHWFSQ